jgi:hypothetical protein
VSAGFCWSDEVTARSDPYDHLAVFPDRASDGGADECGRPKEHNLRRAGRGFRKSDRRRLKSNGRTACTADNHKRSANSERAKVKCAHALVFSGISTAPKIRNSTEGGQVGGNCFHPERPLGLIDPQLFEWIQGLGNLLISIHQAHTH